MSVQDKLRIKAIFTQAQHSIAAHKKLLSELKSLHNELPNKFFFDSFTECLRVPLMCGEKMAPTERTLDFAVKFVTSFILMKNPKESDNTDEEGICDEDEMPTFVTDVFKFMCENAGAENQTVRFRICQFINKLLNGLGNEACMDDELCDLLCDRMSERLKDKSPLVRSQAVRALYRLQDPGDPECRVTSAYIFHIACDPSADVRGTALANIAISTISAPPITERSQDTNETVRKIAFTRLAELNIQRFSIQTRVTLLERGLKDSSEKVRKTAIHALLRSWFELYKGSHTALLLALDCEHSTEISTLALETMFEAFKTGLPSAIDQIRALQGSDKLIPVEELVAEKVLLWKVLIIYLEKHPEVAEGRPVDEPLEDLVPELSTFCTYILKYFNQPLPSVDPYEGIQREYILRQLLEMCETFDLSDEVGRSNLRSTCQKLMLHNNVSDHVIPVLVNILVKVIPSLDDRLQFLAEIIAELHDPSADTEESPAPPVVQMSAEEKRQLEVKEAKMRLKLNELTEDQDEAVKAKDFIRAQQLQDECQKLRDELKVLTAPPCQVEEPTTQESRSSEAPIIRDRGKLQKCLSIVKEMMQHPSIVSLTPTLRSLMHNFVMPCLQQQANDPVVKNMALEAMGLFCLLDIDLAKEHFVYMFCFQIANDEVCETALKTTLDLLHLYGLEAFEVEESKTDEPSKKRPKKKNLFVTDTTEDEYEEDEDDTQSQTINSTNANTANLIGMLTSLLNSASTNMRNLAMKGLCKLLLACRMTSSALLSRLMVMWYSPVTDGDEDFRQPLATFFETLSTLCPRGPEMLEQAFLPTVRTIRDAPADSPISEVDLESVTKLFISLTRPGKNKYHKKLNTHVHNSYAVTLCNEILNQYDRYADDSVLLRALLQLELCLDDPVFRQDLQKFIVLMKESFQMRRERVMYKHVEKFEKKIQELTSEEPVACAEVDNTAQTEHLNNVDSTVRTDGLNSVNNTAQSNQLNSSASTVKKPRKITKILVDVPLVGSDGYASEESVDFSKSREFNGIVIPETPESQCSQNERSGRVDSDSLANEAELQYSKRRRISSDTAKKAETSDKAVSKPGTSKGGTVLAEGSVQAEDSRSQRNAAGATSGHSTRSLRSDRSQGEVSSLGGALQRESRSTRRTVDSKAEPAKNKTAGEGERRESPRKSKVSRGLAEPMKRKGPEKRTNQKKASPVKSVDSQESAEDDAEPAKRRAVDKPTNQRKGLPVKSVDSQESSEDGAESAKRRAVDKRTNQRKGSPVKSVDSQESSEDGAESAKRRAVNKRTNQRKGSPVKSVDSQESSDDGAESAKRRAVDKRTNQRKGSPVKSVDSQESSEDGAESAKRRAVNKRTNQSKDSPVKSKDAQNKLKRAVNVVVVDISAGRPIRELKLTPKLLAYKEDLSKRSPVSNNNVDRRPAPTASIGMEKATPHEKDYVSESSAESSAELTVRVTRRSQTSKPAEKQITRSKANERAQNDKGTSTGTSSDDVTASPASSVRSRGPAPSASPLGQRQGARSGRNEKSKRATRPGSFSLVQSSSSVTTAGRASRSITRPDGAVKAASVTKSPAMISSDEAASLKRFPLRSKVALPQQSSSSDSPLPASSSSGSYKPNTKTRPTKMVIPPSSSEESSDSEGVLRRDSSIVVIPPSSSEESLGREAAVRRATDSSDDSPATIRVNSSNDILQRAVERVRSGVLSEGSSPEKNTMSSGGDIIERAVERVRRSSVFSGESSSGSSSTVYRILPTSSPSASLAKRKSSGSSPVDTSKKTSASSEESPTRSTEKVTSKRAARSSTKKTSAEESSLNSDTPPSKANAKRRDKAKSSVGRLSSSSMSSPSMSTRSQDFPNKLRARKRV